MRDETDDDLKPTAADDPELTTARVRWVEFYVPRMVGDALRPGEIAAAAHAFGCPRPHYQYKPLPVPDDRALIVAEYNLVPFIIESFIEMAKSSDGEPARAACVAAMAGLEIIAP
jgi:hypothetical protein